MLSLQRVPWPSATHHVVMKRLLFFDIKEAPEESDEEEGLGPVLRALTISQSLGGHSSLIPQKGPPYCGGHLGSDPGLQVGGGCCPSCGSSEGGTAHTVADVTYVWILKKPQGF